jgi:hypothetical protein
LQRLLRIDPCGSAVLNTTHGKQTARHSPVGTDGHDAAMSKAELILPDPLILMPSQVCTNEGGMHKVQAIAQGRSDVIHEIRGPRSAGLPCRLLHKS